MEPITQQPKKLRLPSLVLKLTQCHEAWVVGSGARTNNHDPRDWDVLVPFSHWKQAAVLIPNGAKTNSFGGWKCVDNGATIDIWPGDLADFMTHGKANAVWHPKSGIRYEKSINEQITNES